VSAVYVGVLSVRNWQEEGFFCLEITVQCRITQGPAHPLCSPSQLASVLPRVPSDCVEAWFHGTAPVLYVEEEPCYGARKLLPTHWEKTAETRASHDLVVFVILVDSSQNVLLVQEPKRKQYKWFLPAGHIDEGETLFQGVIRECREESGLEVRPSRLMYMVYGNVKWAPLHFIVEAEVIGGKLKTLSEEDNESKCAQWCPLSEVMAELTPTQPFPPRNCRQEFGYRDGGFEVSSILRHYIFTKSTSGGIPLFEYSGSE